MRLFVALVCLVEKQWKIKSVLISIRLCICIYSVMRLTSRVGVCQLVICAYHQAPEETKKRVSHTATHQTLTNIRSLLSANNWLVYCDFYLLTCLRWLWQTLLNSVCWSADVWVRLWLRVPTDLYSVCLLYGIFEYKWPHLFTVTYV